jgi:hypothetical protein
MVRLDCSYAMRANACSVDDGVWKSKQPNHGISMKKSLQKTVLATLFAGGFALAMAV